MALSSYHQGVDFSPKTLTLGCSCNLLWLMGLQQREWKAWF